MNKELYNYNLRLIELEKNIKKVIKMKYNKEKLFEIFEIIHNNKEKIQIRQFDVLFDLYDFKFITIIELEEYFNIIK